jgi:hypothetical protein
MSIDSVRSAPGATVPANDNAAAARTRPRERALLSAIVPGLGQLVQRRFLAATLQFGTVAAYLLSAFGLGSGRAMLLALIWNVVSVVDAYRHEAD